MYLKYNTKYHVEAYKISWAVYFPPFSAVYFTRFDRDVFILKHVSQLFVRLIYKHLSMMRKLHILILAYDRQCPFGALLTDVFFFEIHPTANCRLILTRWTCKRHQCHRLDSFFSSFTDSCNQIKYRHWD